MKSEDAKRVIRAALQPGSVVQSAIGDLAVINEHAEGGNSLVYQLRDDSRREYAMKVLTEDVGTTDSNKARRFRSEFKSMLILSSTGSVVPVYCYGHLERDKGLFPYVVMEWMPRTLEQYVGNVRVSSPDALGRILRSLLRCLSVAHRMGVVHRDLKPANVLMKEDSSLVLSDFGIAWLDPKRWSRSHQTKKGERLANFAFSAPEQFSRNPKPHPTMDLFAVGQIAEWLATGDVARGERVPLSSVDSVLAVFDPIVERLLQRDPSKRPQSADEVINMITEALTSKQKRQQEFEERVLQNLEKFDEALCESLPGKRGLIKITDLPTMKKVLDAVAARFLPSTHDNLWWSQGSSAVSIQHRLRESEPNDFWLMDHMEIRPVEAWVYKDPGSWDHEYILLHCDPMPPFGVYPPGTSTVSEGAAFFRGRYIPREEYEDGWTSIDGESVKTTGEADLRVRRLTTDYYFIATKISCVVLLENQELVTEAYENLLSGANPETVLAPLRKLPIHNVSKMYR